MALFAHHNHIARGDGLRIGEADDVANEARRLIAQGVKMCGGLKSAYDRPNGHNLLEIATRDVACLRTVHLTSSGRFEQGHAQLKNVNERMWNHMLERSIRRISLQMALEGRSWVRAGERVRLSKAARNDWAAMKHWNDAGKVDSLLFLSFLHLLSNPKVEAENIQPSEDADGWRVIGYLKRGLTPEDHKSRKCASPTSPRCSKCTC